MTPEKLFHQMLGLGNEWQVTDCRFDENNGVFLEIKEAPGLWATLRCPQDGGEVFCYDHTEALEWRHLNVFEHHCHIRCHLPRAKCRQCGHIHRVRPPWEGLSKHFTQAFEAYALLLAREMPIKRAAAMVEETDTRFWRLIDAHVTLARAADDQRAIFCVGVDEMNVRKGHQYITVFADLEQRRVLFGTDGKDASVWMRFAQDLRGHNGDPNLITEVSMDMSQAYQKGVSQYCPNARMVFDKYHVIANVCQAVDHVRKTERTGAATKPEKTCKTHFGSFAKIRRASPRANACVWSNSAPKRFGPARLTKCAWLSSKFTLKRTKAGPAKPSSTGATGCATLRRSRRK